MDINFHQRIYDKPEQFWKFYGNHCDFLATFINRLQWYEYPRHYFVSEFPLHVDIETTSNCNMNCPMCFRKKFGDLGDMEWDVFTKIIDECEENGLYSIRLSWRGEALVHPQIFDMIEYAIGKIPNVSFLTNTYLVTKEVSDFIIDKGLSYLGCSFDGIGEIYDKVRSPAKFDGSLNNLKYLRQKRDQLGLTKPQIRACSIWPAISMDPTAYYDCLSQVADLIVVNEYKDFNLPLDPIPGFVCQYPWERLVIAHSGRVQCCTGWNAEGITLGNVQDTSLRALWHGDKLTQMRESHKMKRRTDFKGCSMCRHGDAVCDQSISIHEIISRGH